VPCYLNDPIRLGGVVRGLIMRVGTGQAWPNLGGAAVVLIFAALLFSSQLALAQFTQQGRSWSALGRSEMATKASPSRYPPTATPPSLPRTSKIGVVCEINVRDIGTIFITHHHDDHTAGLGTLMSVAWDNQRTSPINVYGPPPTEAVVKAAVQYYGISAEIRIADGGRSIPVAQIFNGHDVGTGLIYQDTNIKVSAVQNSHFDFHKGTASGKHKSYSYRFETPDRVIVFTSDTGVSEAVTELAKNADLLVTETSSFEERMKLMIASGQWQAMTPAEQEGITRQATQGHMTFEDIGKMAAHANVKTVLLSHYLPRADGNYVPWVSEVKNHFAGQVLVARDLMEF
jgi:ribonuclease BN (tRNA processing enzyme)